MPVPFSTILKSAAAWLILFWSTSVAPEPENCDNWEPTSHLAALGLQLRPQELARDVWNAGASNIRLGFASPLDPNAPGARTAMPLIVATIDQDWEMVRRLLAANAPADIADNLGLTPLMAAAANGNAEIVSEFLARKVKPSALDISGRSALHYAIAAGEAHVAELLLPATENLSAMGAELLALAVRSGQSKIVRALLDRVPGKLQWTSTTQHSLRSALAAGDKEFVRLLMTRHATPPLADGVKVPLIADAIATNNMALFKTLLECGADPNTVLPVPGDSNFIARLPSKFLRHYAEEENGVTLLMLAAGLGRDDYVQALLHAGANRNLSTARDKMMALYFAARSESWKCVQTLLGHGPSPDQLRIEVNVGAQRVALIREGVSVFTTPCSTGREGFSTPAGEYVITDKDRDHRSSIYKVGMPFFMRLNCRDFGLHEGVVPRYAASHGCIRLPGDAARKLFAEIPVGTVVRIN